MSLSLLTSDMALTLNFAGSSRHSPTSTALLPNLCNINLHFCEHCFKGHLSGDQRGLHFHNFNFEAV